MNFPNFPQEQYGQQGFNPYQQQQGGYAPVAQQFPQQFPQGQQFQTPNQVVQNVQGQQGQQLAAGSLDDFFNQPSVGGGPALKFEGVGTRHAGIVARAVTNADIQQQTQPGSNIPATYKDGRPKFVMKVPLIVQASQAHPDGQAQWYVSGAARDELVRAMAEAGAPAGPPEAGATIVIECTGTRPSGPGMNPAKIYKVSYTPPTKETQQAVESVEQASQEPAQNTSPPPASQASQPGALQPPDGMSPEQQQLLSQLTGVQG